MDNFMVTCKYNWKNHCYEITDTKGFHEKIKKDCSFAKSLFDKLENQKFKTKGNTIVVPDNNCKDQDENFEEKHVEEEHVTDCAEDGGTEFCNKRKGIDESKTVKGVDSKGKKMKASKTKEEPLGSSESNNDRSILSTSKTERNSTYYRQKKALIDIGLVRNDILKEHVSSQLNFHDLYKEGFSVLREFNNTMKERNELLQSMIEKLKK
ncbi:hypothetical protein G9C98_001391 [Cotesia typhae]|uniref:Uncharacterized protein n=1 Tax=Cotesia typhae TaxID=2053667 RepID=A0A8J5QMG8_9HYME|nr:hypothetical protein G9C98_001391 [Cotesia typhae]